ncbi:MAG TPA: type II secretion system F family protein [Bryobacteraceae bacterium]|nr:type II secretion system F family protein [Bryobacteraceae bacterium]
MAILLSCVVFLVFAVLLSLAGMKMYVRPREAMERVAGTIAEANDITPTHPSLIFRDIVKKLGALVPASPKDVTVMQRRLIRAGYRQENALKILYGAKVLFGVLIPALTLASIASSQVDPSNKVVSVLIAASVGFFGPNEYVRMVAKRRQKQVQRGLANALDLMVVCVESGLGLDQAILQVAKELEQAHPEICEEFSIVNLELKAGKRRAESLRNLADRSGVEDLKKLVAVLIQADRFGTGVAQSLRAHSDYMRVQARQIAEEKAAKLGVKLVFPIFFCILPSLFVVTVGPVVMKIVRELLPMMNNM